MEVFVNKIFVNLFRFKSEANTSYNSAVWRTFVLATSFTDRCVPDFLLILFSLIELAFFTVNQDQLKLHKTLLLSSW